MVQDSEVEERVNILESLRLEDDQPNIEAPALAVACDTTIGFNFQDRNAYDTHWIDETVAMEKLVSFQIFLNIKEKKTSSKCKKKS